MTISSSVAAEVRPMEFKTQAPSLLTDDDMVDLRELHAATDLVVLARYGWNHLHPQHGFHVNDRGQVRFTLSPEARRALLL
jgi:hypothetical protein